MTRFFHLTSAFFGLTSEYKPTLLEEVYICTQHLDGFSYTDVLALPVYERRFFLSLKARDISKQKEHIETTSNAQSNSKGNRTTNISGENLKNRIKNGDLPLN